MKNLITRALTGFIYVVLLAGCTIYSPVTAYMFFAIMAALTLLEFGSLVNKYAGADMPRAINALAGFILVSAVWLYSIGGQGAGQMFAVYVALMLYLIIGELYRRAENPLQNWALAFASQLYVALPFALLPLLSVTFDEAGQPVYQWIFPMALFVFIWCNDTGAYLVGCSMQRYIPAKLFPRISPKKSWVGSAGGCVVTLVAAALVGHYLPAGMPMWRWLGFGLVVVVFGTWGDLVESLLKRQLGIKDSGHILPGHGGFLDRFDSALITIPAVIVYMFLTQG